MRVALPHQPPNLINQEIIKYYEKCKYIVGYIVGVDLGEICPCGVGIAR